MATLNIGGDFAVMDNLETVTYCVRTGDSTFAAGVTVNNALRRAQGKSEQGFLGQAELVWHLWASQLPGVVPKVFDVVQDGVGIRWTVTRVDIQSLSTRYRLSCTRERS